MSEEKTFMRISNRDVYDEIKGMRQEIRERMDAAEQRLSKIEQQIAWHQVIGGFIITGIIGSIVFFINWIKDLGGK